MPVVSAKVVAPVASVAPAVIPSVELVCTKLMLNIRPVKVLEQAEMVKAKEENREPLLHSCVRDVTTAVFMVEELDPEVMPRVKVVFDSLNGLPYQEGARYRLVLEKI